MLHIDLPTRTDIETLLAWRGAPAVSIYLRTTPLTQDAQAGRIELKNLLKAAVAEMEAADTPKRSIWPISEAIEALIEDEDFWAYQANSLAVFANGESIRTFRLPNHLTNTVEVSDRFHLKPLIRSITFPHNAYVLALSRGAVRLLEVSADLPPHEVSVPNLPKSMASELGRSGHSEKATMAKTEASSEHALLTRFVRSVDAALRPVLAGHSRPLIVAAAEPLSSVYRAVSTYPHTATEVIAGNAETTPDHELAAAARAILDRIYAEELRGLGSLYAERGAQGRATSDIAQAARAATYGAVDTLLVDMDAVVPGTVDDEGTVAFGESGSVATYGVVDEIVRRVLQGNGRVVSARRSDIPEGGDLAAILRYAV